MTNSPLISVVLTTHHRPELLKRALNSLFVQKIKNFEVILCSDESSEQTKNIANLMLRPQDTFVSAPNLKGPAQTRNLGVQIAVGEWICFLDDDDSFRDDYFKVASELLAGKDFINYFNYTEIIESRLVSEQKLILSTDKRIQPNSIGLIEVGNCMPINALFLSATIAKQNPFDAYLQSHEDWDWLIGLAKRGYKFKQHEHFGPNVHMDENISRNSEAIRSGSRALDFLSIYRKWPSSSNEIKDARANQMAALGLPIPPFFL